VPDLPSHPAAGDGAAAEPPGDSRPPGARRLRTLAIAVIVVALLAVMVVLHVTGVVGAGTNG
jgi:hypothetical protein